MVRAVVFMDFIGRYHNHGNISFMVGHEYALYGLSSAQGHSHKRAGVYAAVLCGDRHSKQSNDPKMGTLPPWFTVLNDRRLMT
jgi:hypothetical protein